MYWRTTTFHKWSISLSNSNRESTLRTEAEVHILHERAISQAKVITVFESYVDESPSRDGEHVRRSDRLHVWLGNTLRGQFDSEYLKHRDALSDAAYFGRWDELSSILDIGERKYSEPWANCPRLSRSLTLTFRYQVFHVVHETC